MTSFTDLATLTAIVAGIVQSIKIAVGERFNRFMPLVADLLGGTIGFYFLGGNREAVLLGIIVGLAASGLYSQAKATVGK